MKKDKLKKKLTNQKLKKNSWQDNQIFKKIATCQKDAVAGAGQLKLLVQVTLPPKHMSSLSHLEMDMKKNKKSLKNSKNDLFMKMNNLIDFVLLL